MRMSASLFDNLRQPGVYESLNQTTRGDERKMRRAVLARIRLDDLLTNISLGTQSRLVFSMTDVLDGRLFTLLRPDELEGIDFEVVCHPKLAAGEPHDVVPRLLRSWIHDESGNGRPGGFLAAGESLHRRVAESLRSESGLNVTTLRDARDIAKKAGVDPPELEKLVELWERWHHAIESRRVRLTPWGSAASAVTLLEKFLTDHESNRQMAAFALTERGTEIFRQSLSLLREHDGRRDAPIKFLLDEISKMGSDAEEAREVHRLFQHYTFSAIAHANNASPEFTSSIGDQDSGLSSNDLDRIEKQA